MKIAVPSHGDVIDEHFGHCEAFSIFTVGDGRQIVDQTRLVPPSSCGCKSNLIDTLAEMGVSVLLAGGMGQGAVSALTGRGITVVRGASGPTREAVEAWLAGRINDSQETCHSHESCPGH